jgi:hypothetical protein
MRYTAIVPDVVAYALEKVLDSYDLTLRRAKRWTMPGMVRVFLREVAVGYLLDRDPDTQDVTVQENEDGGLVLCVSSHTYPLSTLD